MSQTESIEFTCPNCNTGLTVPAQLAGITGPCPHCQAAIVAPHPVPAFPASAAETPAAPVQQIQPVPPTQPAPAEIPEQLAGREPIPSKAPSPAQSPPQAAAEMVAPSAAPVQQHSSSRRKIWPSILFPALFLILAAAVVYLILDLMGLLSFGKDSPKTEEQTPVTQTQSEESKAAPSFQEVTPSPASPAPSDASLANPDQALAPSTDPVEEPILLEPTPPKNLEHDPQDLKKSGEVGGELPDLASKAASPGASFVADSVEKRTAAIKEAEVVLQRFLVAQTFAERKPLITKSEREDEELAASSLGKPFPKSFVPELLTTREREEDRSFEVFFSVAFDQADQERSKIVLIRTITYSEEDSPKIHTDPFLDLYEEPIRDFYEKKKSGTGTFNSIVEFSAFCFDDIPKASSMAKVTFYTFISASAKPIATGYLSKESQAFKELSKKSKSRRKIPATVSVAWDTESDPEKPYLQVIRIEAINWTL